MLPGRSTLGIMKEADPFYRSRRWKSKREKILRRDRYICQSSKRYGKIVQADTVHHIFPRDSYPQYELCDWNLISLCSREHDRMHYRLTNELTAYGLDLMRRTARKFGINVSE